MRSTEPVASIRHAILVLLSEGPKSPRQLCEALEASTMLWPVTVDQVDAALRRLERDGLVASEDAREETSETAGWMG